MFALLTTKKTGKSQCICIGIAGKEFLSIGYSMMFIDYRIFYMFQKLPALFVHPECSSWCDSYIVDQHCLYTQSVVVGVLHT